MDLETPSPALALVTGAGVSFCPDTEGIAESFQGGTASRTLAAYDGSAILRILGHEPSCRIHGQLDFLDLLWVGKYMCPPLPDHCIPVSYPPLAVRKRVCQEFHIIRAWLPTASLRLGPAGHLGTIQKKILLHDSFLSSF